MLGSTGRFQIVHYVGRVVSNFLVCEVDSYNKKTPVKGSLRIRGLFRRGRLADVREAEGFVDAAEVLA